MSINATTTFTGKSLSISEMLLKAFKNRIPTLSQSLWKPLLDSFVNKMDNSERQCKMKLTFLVYDELTKTRKQIEKMSKSWNKKILYLKERKMFSLTQQDYKYKLLLHNNNL